MFRTDFANTEHTKERFKDYIVKRLLCRDVVVGGNPKVYKALKNQLAEVLSELQRIENSSASDELLETIRLINITLNGMKGEY